MSFGYVWRHKDGDHYQGRVHVITTDLQAAAVCTPFYGDYVPVFVRVTEEPGPAIREIVELRGAVDLDGLKFAIQTHHWFWDAMRAKWGPIAEATPYVDLETIMSAIRVGGVPIPAVVRIVGIREVPGSTVRKIEEITE